MVTILRDKPRTIKSYAEENIVTIRAAIIKVITDKVLTLATYKHPTPDQIEFFIDLILRDYSQLSTDDLSLMMDNGLKGLYGVKKGEPDNIISFDSEVMLRWLQKYSEEKRVAAMNFNPSPNQFPVKPRYEKPSYKMPESVRELLKRDIGYEYKAPDEKPKKINWKERIPSLTDQEVTIYEYFDDLWNEQGCRLKVKTTDPIVEVEGHGDMTRGQFVHHAKKLIEQNNNH